jgi:hypothetical protein
MSPDEMRKAASMGAKLELCAMGTLMGPEAHLEWMRHWRRVGGAFKAIPSAYP